MNTVKVELGDRGYDILIGRGILLDLASQVKKITKKKKCAVISNPRILELYGDIVDKSLTAGGLDHFFIDIPDSETAKSFEVAASVFHRMLDNGLDRNSFVIALGGGVVGDLAGFTAATYMRGIPIIQVPTTLLAQVDSAVGGKCGIDLSAGKNLVGAFHQPSLVIVDIDLLKTLSDPDFRSGLAEVIKYGIILDEKLFEFLETNSERILAREPAALEGIISGCCAIKAGVVGEDERESGSRMILNLGHTLGHAVETLTGYTEISHGEAVAIGTIFAARLSVKEGLSKPVTLERIIKIMKLYDLPISINEGIDISQILAAMKFDKKADEGRLRFVLPTGIGNVKVIDEIPDERVLSVLEEMSG